MQSRHDELRDELVAILGAGRELTGATDQQLADAFIQHPRAAARARNQEVPVGREVPPTALVTEGDGRGVGRRADASRHAACSE